MRAEIAVETFSILASVSGEWQVTASVTNESSVQLHLFNVLLWRANHSSLFVKLSATPQERREWERKLNIYRSRPSCEYCYKPLTLKFFTALQGIWEGGTEWLDHRAGPQLWQYGILVTVWNIWPDSIMSYLISDLRSSALSFTRHGKNTTAVLPCSGPQVKTSSFTVRKCETHGKLNIYVCSFSMFWTKCSPGEKTTHVSEKYTVLNKWINNTP